MKPLPPWIDAIDAYWARFLGCQVGDLKRPGDVFVSGGARQSGLAALGRNGWRVATRDPLSAARAESLMELLHSTSLAPHEREARLQEWAAAAGLLHLYGPAELLYTTDTPRLAESVAIREFRQLTTQDGEYLRLFLTELGLPREYEVDQPANYPYVLGAWNGPQLAGVCAVRLWDQLIGEVFVDVLTPFRGKGLGAHLAARATAWVVSQGLIAQYDTECTNQPSLAVAGRLSYQPYGTLVLMD